MVASRTRTVNGCCSARFWFSAFFAALLPTSVGYQDLAAYLTHEPAVPAHWGEHLIASPFGTIEPATFSYSRPIGTAMPHPVGLQTVSFDPNAATATMWSIDRPLTVSTAAQVEYPTVNRRNKGDRLPSSDTAPSLPAAPVPNLPQLQPIAAPPDMQPIVPAAPALPPSDTHKSDAGAPVVHADIGHDSAASLSSAAPPTDAGVVAMRGAAGPAAAEAHGANDDDDIDLADKPPDIPSPGESADANAASSAFALLDDDVADHSAQIYFGVGALGSPNGLQQWAPGAEPVLTSAMVDAGLKLSALQGRVGVADEDGESVAAKGDASRLESPAVRLGLAGKTLARSQKCLADAVYFEARGEPLKGQEAVAQVVMNRVFSGYYPSNVCGVVYQNANRHLACQFTFACEGKDLSRINEPDMWEQAKRIARDELDGKIWLTDVGHATHYHAYWVHPSWVHEMTKLYKLGVHTFYRPRAWGNGSDEPKWGPEPVVSKADGAPNKAEVAAAIPDAAPTAMETTAFSAVPLAVTKSDPTAKL